MSNTYYTEPLSRLHSLSSTYCRSLSTNDWEKILKFKNKMVSYITDGEFETRHTLKSRFLFITGLIDTHYITFLEFSKSNLTTDSKFSHLVDELIEKYSNRFEYDIAPAKL